MSYSYFSPKGPTAACQHAATNQTDLFFFNSSGQLCVMSVVGAGQWTPPQPLTYPSFGVPGGGVAASPQFGTSTPQTDVFGVDEAGTLQVFWQETGESSWNRAPLSDPGACNPGSSIAVVPQTIGTSSAPNSTIVFLIDGNNRLTQFAVDQGGHWGTHPISASIAEGGSPVAAFPRMASDGSLRGSDVFFVDANGILNWWTNVTGAWARTLLSAGTFRFGSGSSVVVSRKFGSAGVDFPDLLQVFAVDLTGAMVVHSYNSSNWSAQTLTGPGFAAAGASICVTRHFIPNVNQTDVFVIDLQGNLQVFSAQGPYNWSAPSIVAPNVAQPNANLSASQQFGSPSVSNPYQTDVFLIDLDSKLSVFYAVGANRWNRLQLPQFAGAGASSGNNVRFGTVSGLPIDGATVTIALTEDLVPISETNGGVPAGGLSFQFNCNSAPNYLEIWQQYCVCSIPGYPDTDIYWALENWQLGAGGKAYGNIDSAGLLLSGNQIAGPRIPKGYKIQTRLLQYESSGLVGSIEYSIFDPSGNRVGHWVVPLLDQELRGSGHPNGGPVTTEYLAPVQLITLAIVAHANADFTNFSSGAGTIEYQTENPVDVLVPVINPMGEGTGEGSNILYSAVPVIPGTTFTQSFFLLKPN